MIAEQIDIGQWWAKSGGDDLLVGKDSWQEFYRSLPGYQAAFIDPNTPRYMGCMDEGDQGKPEWKAEKIGLGGAAFGYVRTIIDFRPLMHLLIGTSSHRKGCGYAFKIREERGIIDKTIDEVADEEARITAEKLEIPFLGVVGEEDMKRPDFHIARAIYYDGSGYFIPYKVKSMPPGILIHRGLVSDASYGRELAGAALKILLGAHGFEHQFSERSPLYAVAVTDPGKGVSRHGLISELEMALKQVAEEIGSKFDGQLPVKIDYLIKD